MFLCLRKRFTLTLLLTTLTSTAAAPTAPSATDLIPTNTSGSLDLMTGWDTTVEVEVTPATPPPRPYPRAGNCILSPAMRVVYGHIRNVSDNRIYIQLPLVTVGAIMIFLVNGRRMFKGSAYFYMCVLALADFSFIVATSVHVGIGYMSAGTIYVNNLICSILVFYLPFAFQAFAVSVLMAMTIERTLVVLFPFKFQNFFTVKKAMVILSLLFICSFVTFCPYLWATAGEFNVNTHLYNCGYFIRREEDGTATVIYIGDTNISDAIKVYVYLVIPMIVLLGCNIAIIVALTKAFKTKVKLMGEEKGSQEKSGDQLRHITSQVLSVSILFVVLCLPYACIFHPLSSGLFMWRYNSCTHFFAVLWIKEGAKFLYEMTHCLNAYMYAVSSKKFRIELLEALHIQPTKKSGSGSVTRQTTLPSVSGLTAQS